MPGESGGTLKLSESTESDLEKRGTEQCQGKEMTGKEMGEAYSDNGKEVATSDVKLGFPNITRSG